MDEMESGEISYPDFFFFCTTISSRLFFKGWALCVPWAPVSPVTSRASQRLLYGNSLAEGKLFLILFSGRRKQDMLLLRLPFPGLVGSLRRPLPRASPSSSEPAWSSSWESCSQRGLSHTLRAEPLQVRGFLPSPREFPEQLTKQRPN